MSRWIPFLPIMIRPDDPFITTAPWGKYFLCSSVPVIIAIAIGIGLALKSEHLDCDVDIMSTTWVDSPSNVTSQYTMRTSSWDYHREEEGRDWNVVRKGDTGYWVYKDGTQRAMEKRRGGIPDYCNVSADDDSARFIGKDFSLVERVDGVGHYRHEETDGYKGVQEIWVNEEGHLLRWRRVSDDGLTVIDQIFTDHGIPNIIDPVVDIGWQGEVEE